MLFEQIRQELDKALRDHNQDSLRTLRFLISELNNLVIAKYPPEKGGLPKEGLPDEDVISVVQKLVKTHKESIEAFKAGGRSDLVSKEETEMAILQKYMPEALSEEEIKKIVQEIKASGLSDFGQIMSQVMAKVRGRADGALVAKIVRESL